jgi:D-alanine-D-alanine ligase
LTPANLPPDTEQRLVRVAKRVYRGLSLSGYGRIDFRLTEGGDPFLIEANPNCDLGYGEELHEAAKAAGMTYESLVQRILNLGLTYQAEWRQEL